MASLAGHPSRAKKQQRSTSNLNTLPTPQVSACPFSKFPCFNISAFPCFQVGPVRFAPGLVVTTFLGTAFPKSHTLAAHCPRFKRFSVCSFTCPKGTQFSHPFGTNRRRFTISALLALRQSPFASLRARLRALSPRSVRVSVFPSFSFPLLPCPGVLKRSRITFNRTERRFYILRLPPFSSSMNI